MATELSLTPVQRVHDDAIGALWLKRDDLYTVAGVSGGKARTCWVLAQGATGLVTAGHRQSPQMEIVAHIARELGIPCRAHIPNGPETDEIRSALACGAELVRHRNGRNSYIKAMARRDAEACGWTEIPFGMDHPEAIEQTRKQIWNLPERSALRRIVVPIGSGTTFAGVLNGASDRWGPLPPIVVGVVVGGVGIETRVRHIQRYAPLFWHSWTDLHRHPAAYGALEGDTFIGDTLLDKVYEAKCLLYLQPEDVFWIVGARRSVLARQTATPDELDTAMHTGVD